MADVRTGISRFIVGMMLGAIAALLFAPRTGKETRKQIKETADELYEDSRERVSEGGKRALEVISSQRGTAAQRIDSLKKRIQQTKEEVVQATGEAKGRAIQEAQKLEEQVQKLSPNK